MKVTLTILEKTDEQTRIIRSTPEGDVRDEWVENHKFEKAVEVGHKYEAERNRGFYLIQKHLGESEEREFEYSVKITLTGKLRAASEDDAENLLLKKYPAMKEGEYEVSIR